MLIKSHSELTMLQVINNNLNQQKEDIWSFDLDFFDESIKCSKTIVLVISNCEVNKKGTMKKLIINHFILGIQLDCVSAPAALIKLGKIMSF